MGTVMDIESADDEGDPAVDGASVDGASVVAVVPFVDAGGVTGRSVVDDGAGPDDDEVPGGGG